jgi:deazaflavin-dependent oxidoreductase (nitroreductase family)
VADLTSVAGEAFCYLTTRGRVTGEPHEIEIWFALAPPSTLYLLSGGRDGSDWVQNLVADAAVTVRVRDVTYDASARVLEAGTDEDGRARTLVFEKYDPGYDGSLASWRESALPVALEVR